MTGSREGRGVDNKSLCAAAQALFGAIQVFAAAPTAAVPEVHYFYAATNVIIGAAAAMSM